MMRENELRVGVYIYYCEEVFEVDAECIKMHMGDDLDDAYRPIPLTEEWLLKFGFEITDNFQTKDRFQTHKQDGIIWFEYGYIVVELNYVHQLQNLYFALTNEELTINN
jgi:hypothetical protein